MSSEAIWVKCDGGLPITENDPVWLIDQDWVTAWFGYVDVDLQE